jgi:probable F420-dependent oxidoreductase
VPEIAKAAEDTGLDCLWVAETQHNPFLPGAMIAEHTSRIKFGSAIAVSFARSPAVMAHTAWDLAEFSQGRFILGIGTQVKAHITRRFGMDWPDSVTGKLREQIDVVRAFWQNWQEGDKLNYAGDYYNINLTSPFFVPPSQRYSDIPIYIAGVNTGLAKLAGETAQGFHSHPFHTRRYLDEVLLPKIEEGAQKAGRSRADVQLVAHAFVVTSEIERQLVRQQIAFYASTPSYRQVLTLHGWQEVGERLSVMAKEQKWPEMATLISDEMVAAFATIADPADLAAALKERYQGMAERINLYIPFVPKERDAFWQQLCKDFDQA